MAITIRPGSKISFHDIRYATLADKNGNYSASRWDTDSGLSLNQESLDIIKNLHRGQTVATVCRELGLGLSNVNTILRVFLSAGFIRTVDGCPVPDTQPPIKPWFPRLRRRQLSWLLSKPLLAVSFLFILSAVILALFHPAYLPTYLDFFWADDLFVVALSTTVISWLVLIVHEMAHFLAAKAVGAESSIRFGNRFVFLVAETEHYHLWQSPRLYRYFVYFAGMTADMLIISIIIWIYELSRLFGLGLSHLHGLLAVIFLTEIGGIVWEFSAFLETDMYNFLSDYFDQDNLYADTRRYLRLRFLRIKQKLLVVFTAPIITLFLRPAKNESVNDQRLFTKNDKLIFLTYSLFSVAGLLLTSLIFFFYALPKDLTFILKSIDLFRNSVNTSDFLAIFKSTAAFILSIFPLFILVKILTTRIFDRQSII